METWFTADHHFDHRSIVRLAGRQFDSTESMNEYLVAAWNSRVAPGDVVWHLGDFAFNRRTAFRKELNGKINLIVGNHDKGRFDNAGFETVDKFATLTFVKTKIFVCHYPMMTWPSRWRGTIHLHGHSHGRLNQEPVPRIDVGVDTHPHFAPWHLDQVLEFASILRGGCCDLPGYERKKNVYEEDGQEDTDEVSEE